MYTKIYRLFSALLAIIVTACLFGVQGQFQEQYVTPSSIYPAAAQSALQNPSQYSQFYTLTPGPAPGNPIGAPQQFEISGNFPLTVYLGEQMLPVPWLQYQSNPGFTGANSLWIKGAKDWTQYAAVPQGAIVSLLAVSTTGGSGTLAFVNSDEQTYSHNYIFYQNSLLSFYAGTIGRHMLSFAINGQSSNQVVIDVIGTYTQPSNYPEYNPEYDPGYYYPWYYYPGYYVSSTSPHKNNKGGNIGKDHKVWNHGEDDEGGNIPGLDNKSPGWDHKGWNHGGDNEGGIIPDLDNKSPSWNHKRSEPKWG